MPFADMGAHHLAPVPTLGTKKWPPKAAMRKNAFEQRYHEVGGKSLIPLFHAFLERGVFWLDLLDDQIIEPGLTHEVRGPVEHDPNDILVGS